MVEAAAPAAICAACCCNDALWPWPSELLVLPKSKSERMSDCGNGGVLCSLSFGLLAKPVTSTSIGVIRHGVLRVEIQ